MSRVQILVRHFYHKAEYRTTRFLEVSALVVPNGSAQGDFAATAQRSQFSVGNLALNCWRS